MESIEEEIFGKIEHKEFRGKEINPFLIFPPEQFSKNISRMRGLTNIINNLFPSLRYTLVSLGYEKVHEYILSSVLSTIIFSVLFFSFIYLYGTMVKIEGLMYKSILAGFFTFVILLVFYIIYPSIKAKSFAEQIDKNLLFALKDMLIEIKSGITLYDALVNVAHSDYGLVSKEIGSAVKATNAGVPLAKALERIATRTQSEHLRRVLWQIITAIQSGASVEPALESAIRAITTEQEEKIRKYVANLNFIVLFYMLTASSLPAMILPFLMILICFVSIQIDADLILKVFSVFIILQILIIGFVQSSRPLSFK